MPTLAEIAQVRNTPLSAGIFQAVQTVAPLFSAFDARTRPGTKFKTLAMTGLPSSAFANFNEGFTFSAATFELREFNAALIGGQIKEEVITANEWNQENAATGETYFAIQTEAKMKADIRHVERVLVYGTAHDAKGFPGLKELTPYANVLALDDPPEDDDFTKTVINAGGTTAGTASSVYSVVFGPMDAQLIFGGDSGGELFTMSETIQQMLAPDPAEPTKTSLHNVAQVHGFVGLSVSGMNQTPDDVVPTQYAVRRLANVTEDSGKGVTDQKLERLVLSHNDGVVPDLLAMSGRGGRQLADSRSATSVTVTLAGGGTARDNQFSKQAPRPTHFDGIPIVYTSAINNTDAIEA